ncbi:UNVERIFIED_CONTAM: hypothetical protein Sindi_0981400 [Sesamum indicum]
MDESSGNTRSSHTDEDTDSFDMSSDEEKHFMLMQLLLFITVVYGATEVADRRELWGSLETIVVQCADTPWLIGGDFNAVRDLSEICGTSGDIRMAIEEFNVCIQNTGLIPLPMQGEWYTWHNCNASPRNLWKRLDRMLINDRWMARFLTLFYSSLTPRNRPFTDGSKWG